jgi:L-ascorbate metabolism protein UlaG (beta-lactamase superfamily)
MAEIRWFGHASFRIRAREATLILDPVPRSSGYRAEKQKADIVTISHDHPGHTATENISGDFKIIQGPGEYEMNEVFVTGIRTYHDEERGAQHGRNTVYLIEVEGITFCHLGDLGHRLTDEQVEALESVDVLMVPVGGGTILDAAKAAEVIGQIEPRLVIPMQYRTEYGDKDLDDLDRFLKEMGSQEVTPVDRLQIRQSDLPESTQVVVLEPAVTSR